MAAMRCGKGTCNASSNCPAAGRRRPQHRAGPARRRSARAARSGIRLDRRRRPSAGPACAPPACQLGAEELQRGELAGRGGLRGGGAVDVADGARLGGEKLRRGLSTMRLGLGDRARLWWKTGSSRPRARLHLFSPRSYW